MLFQSVGHGADGARSLPSLPANRTYRGHCGIDAIDPELTSEPDRATIASLPRKHVEAHSDRWWSVSQIRILNLFRLQPTPKSARDGPRRLNDRWLGPSPSHLPSS